MKIIKILKKVNSIRHRNYYIKQYYKSKINENMILLESKSGSDIASNIFYILKELNTNEYSNYKVYIALKKENIMKFKNLLNKYGINNVIILKRLSNKYLKVLATAKYLFNDTSFFSGFMKKDGQIYVNTWHGTPLKHMSNDVPNRRYAMGNTKRNFLMCDYLLYPNGEMEDKMISAYSIRELFKGKILNAGYPRNAIFFDDRRRLELRRKLGLEEKQIIVYMPTWRGEMGNKKTKEQIEKVMSSIKIIDKMLNDNQLFYIKFHIFTQQELNFDNFKHIRPFPTDYETYDFLNIADCLVTDYSSVFFDFANSGKKIVLYTYDKDEYITERGLYYDLDKLPFPKVNTPKELVNEINSNKNYDDREFKKRFCTYDNKDASKDLVDFIIKNKKSSSIKLKEIENNNKKNTLIYSSSLPLNGITTSLLSLLSIIDLEKENIFISFRETSLKSFPLRLEKLPKTVNIFPISSGFRYSYKELVAYILFYKLNFNNNWVHKTLDKFYQREIYRFFGNSKIDQVIQFTGYEKLIIGLFQRFNVPKAIFVHSDMISEIKTRKNQHLLTLKDAYKNYDKVVNVSEAIIPSTLKISNKKDNIAIINNAHNYKKIITEKEKEIEFDEETESNVSLSVLKKIFERKDTIKFINIGRYSFEKGHERLINAFDKFYKNHQNAFLFIIGGHGSDWEKTNEYVKKLECRYNVILIKYMTNPFPVLKQCDLFILSSYYESLGLVILEAETCGVKVISTDIEGPRAFMKEHGGYLVENSEEGLYQGMIDFMDGKVKRLNFDPEKYNQQVKQQYEHLFDDLEENK